MFEVVTMFSLTEALSFTDYSTEIDWGSEMETVDLLEVS